jgi:hypothetical protein
VAEDAARPDQGKGSGGAATGTQVTGLRTSGLRRLAKIANGVGTKLTLSWRSLRCQRWARGLFHGSNARIIRDIRRKIVDDGALEDRFSGYSPLRSYLPVSIFRAGSLACT